MAPAAALAAAEQIELGHAGGSVPAGDVVVAFVGLSLAAKQG